MRAVFSRKEPKIEAKEFCVEKVIMLPAGEYESFTNHLMHRHDFIMENLDFMYEKDGVRHCLLVTGEGMEEGVLVESEGSLPPHGGRRAADSAYTRAVANFNPLPPHGGRL